MVKKMINGKLTLSEKKFILRCLKVGFLSYRRIAKMIGCSHQTIKLIKDQRKKDIKILTEMGYTKIEEII